MPVPSNPEALVTARNAGLITVKDFEKLTNKTEDKSKEKDRQITQDKIRDEMSYLKSILIEKGLADFNSEIALELSNLLLRLAFKYLPVKVIWIEVEGKKIEFSRLTGNDIPVEIKVMRDAMNPILKMLDDDLGIHTKCNESVKKALEKLCKEPELESAQDWLLKEIKKHIS